MNGRTVRSTEWKSEEIGEIWRAVRSTEWKSEEIGRILQSEKTGLLKERLLFSDQKLLSLSTTQQESNPWPANLYLGFSKNERKENGASYAMNQGSHKQDAHGGYKHLLWDEKKKKNVTSLRLVLDETEMVQAKAESGAKTKGERS